MLGQSSVPLELEACGGQSRWEWKLQDRPCSRKQHQQQPTGNKAAAAGGCSARQLTSGLSNSTDPTYRPTFNQRYLLRADWQVRGDHDLPMTESEFANRQLLPSAHKSVPVLCFDKLRHFEFWVKYVIVRRRFAPSCNSAVDYYFVICPLASENLQTLCHSTDNFVS